ncbi:UxaA family hydrolase [Halosimplex pelagicum]|uniref:UxaA family hydrolase n=1 Tax=Halosimplex pelagicum TaxID=869886 RepID=A0A7D5PDL1_9EURY|nr:UxaA family hydrolase [Halosimplex pelagicum]QLH84262.1 UxaA family hydrolase [Halosimplex pelagicum]
MKGEVLDGCALVMADDDTVATALEDLDEGDRLDDADPPVVVAEEVPFGHKVALVDIDAGDPVRKYDEVIGEATESIERGEWVHTHNCESTRGRGDRAAETTADEPGGGESA